MAQLFRAQITPTKPEVLAAFVPTRPWSGGQGVDEVLGAYRFDDPAGEVGVEVHLVRGGDTVFQVPLTYRPAPLPGGGEHLLTEMEHSILGRRWIYDGCGDPVFATTLAAAVLAGAPQPELWVQDAPGDTPTRREPDVAVVGSGSGDAPEVSVVRADDDGPATIVSSPEVQLVVRRVLDADLLVPPGSDTLSGTWSGAVEPVVLATGRRV